MHTLVTYRKLREEIIPTSSKDSFCNIKRKQCEMVPIKYVNTPHYCYNNQIKEEN